jgi:hypothetical protein
MEEIFVAKPGQLEKKIAEWTAQAPEILQVDAVASYSGHNVYGLTISDFSVPREEKRAHYFAQPHAHEPGATAGMIDVIEQLCTGQDLWGWPTPLDRQRILTESVLTFNPIGNPQGRAAAPVRYWDGSRHTNDEFWCWMRGEDPENPGQMWKRLDIWDDREENAPKPVGIVYEQIDAHRYVEPNRHQSSSYFRLFRKLDARYGYDRWLDLHQTEFVNSPHTCEILLPLEGLTQGAIAATNRRWGERIVAAWYHAGFRALPQPVPLSYTGVQAAYFRRNWEALHRRMNIITTEIKNNALDAPPQFQLRAQVIAIQESIQALLEED